MSIGVLHGQNGGNGGLAIRVVGSSVRPESPKENTIWVKTDAAVTKWHFRGEANPVWAEPEGTVFITSSTVPANTYINVIKENPKQNAIFSQLLGCIQYSAGAWRKREAYVYKGGTWVQFSTEFTATINVTYPAGSTCSATDGTTTLTAPDTSGTWACAVPNAGTWTISITNNAGTKSKSVTITSNGQTANCILGAPSDYQEVVYLQSTGTQYINPNLTGKTYRFRVNTKASIAEGGGRLYGDDYPPFNMLFAGNDNSNITPICTYNGASFGSKLTVGTVYTLDRTCSNSGIVTVKNNGETIATYDASSRGFDNTKTKSPYIFCYNSQGAPSRYAKATLYWMTIYDVDGITKLREFVPCYRKSDSVAGLYDLVNDVFYTNSGSGTFVVGGDV